MNNDKQKFHQNSQISWPLALIIVCCGTLTCSRFAKAETSTVPGNQALSVSGGIAVPSFSTAVFQNSSGLINVPDLNFNGQAGADSSFDNPQASGALMYGNGSVGLGGGLTFEWPTGANTTDSLAFFGLAVGIPNTKASVGLAGQTGLSPSGNTVWSAGGRFELSPSVLLGVNIRGFDNSNREWGAGLAVPINPSASLVLDATADHNFKNFNWQPGAIVGGPDAAITVSYGFGDGGSQQLSSGFAAGGSLKINSKINWQVYYNQLKKYYTSISIPL